MGIRTHNNDYLRHRSLVRDVAVSLNGSHVEGIVAPELVSYTLDFWPEWTNSSITVGVNLTSPQLLELARGLAPAFLRIGGSQSDRVTYVVPKGDGSPASCPHKGEPERCLAMDRWIDILTFAEKAGARIVYCLAYLNGIHKETTDWKDGEIGVYEFLNYTRHHAPTGIVYGFELGNEPFHNPTKTQNATRYKLAYQTLSEYIHELWDDVVPPEQRPKLVGPAGSSGSQFNEALKQVGEYLDVVTFHYYYMGSGDDSSLLSKSLAPHKFVANHKYNEMSLETSNLQHGESSKIELWFGEGAMAYHSGRDGVSNTFASSFSYAFQLGQMALVKPLPVKVFCRQTLMGGNYGLISHDGRFQPNPDYWIAYLWTKLMGTVALQVEGIDCCVPGEDQLLLHASCAKPSRFASDGDVVLVFININTNFGYKIHLSGDFDFAERSDFLIERADGEKDVATKNIVVNGQTLDLDVATQEVPLEPNRHVHSHKEVPIHIPKVSILFTVLHNVTGVPSCIDGLKNATISPQTDKPVSLEPTTTVPTVVPTPAATAMPTMAPSSMTTTDDQTIIPTDKQETPAPSSIVHTETPSMQHTGEDPTMMPSVMTKGATTTIPSNDQSYMETTIQPTASPTERQKSPVPTETPSINAVKTGKPTTFAPSVNTATTTIAGIKTRAPTTFAPSTSALATTAGMSNVEQDTNHGFRAPFLLLFVVVSAAALVSLVVCRKKRRAESREYDAVPTNEMVPTSSFTNKEAKGDD